MNRRTRFSSAMKRISSPGMRMKRRTWSGSGTSARIFRVPSMASSSSAREKPRLAMKGNGCAGSMARGVKTGKTCFRKYSPSQSTSSVLKSFSVTTEMPAPASSTCRRLHTASCSRMSRALSWATSANCSAGVRPSRLFWVTPLATWPLRPARRTMKNSSRLLADIERKRSRSSTGWRRLLASASTRQLKESQESSRFR